MEKIKIEYDKIRKMSFKDALSYIWEYYKLWILAALFLIIFTTSIIKDVAENKGLDPVIKAGVQNDIGFIYDNGFEALINSCFSENTGKTAPAVLYFSSAASADDPYATVQLITWLGAGELDCLICDKETAEFLTNDNDSFSFTDITATDIGEKCEETGLSPVYFLTVKSSPRTEAAGKLLEYITH